MLYVDIPTQKDLTTLRARRDEACVSIYLETTPLTQHIEKSRITLGNLGKEALAQLTDAELADAARQVLDAHYARKLEEFASLFETRAGQNRAISDLSDAVRAATFGAIDTLLVDMDNTVHGLVDEETGAFSDTPDAIDYGIVDEIAGRALDSGANVMAVRREDMPHGGDLAAILRYPV